MKTFGRNGANRDLAQTARHVAILASFAVAQPLFDLLGGAPDFLLAHDLGSAEILILALFLGAAVPLLGWLLVRVACRLHDQAGQGVGTLLLSGLLLLIVMAVLRSLEILDGWPRVALAAVMAASGSVVYWRTRAVRQFVTWLTPGVIVFPAMFVLRPAVVGLVWPQDASLEAHSTSRTPVVMVVFDSLPLTALLDENRLLDRRLYPSFAALADEATWYRNATTVSDYTRWALPAIVTGRYPVASALPTASDYGNSVFTLLGSSHAVRVHEPITRLCPPTLCQHDDESLLENLAAFAATLSVVYLHAVLPEDFEPDLPPVDQGWADEAPPVVPGELWLMEGEEGRRNRLLAFIESIEQTDDSPAAYFIHILLPHTPVVYLPSGQRFTTERYLPGLLEGRDRWTDDTWAADHGYRLFLLQVRYADALLGRLVARLRDVGLYDQALVVVVSDHGASFRAGLPFRRVTDDTFMDILPVPLLIKAPNQRVGMVSDRNVETIDILPTMADLLDVEVPWVTDGASALGPVAARTGKSVYYEDARRVRTFGPSLLEDAFAATDRRLALFGPPDRNPYLVPRTSPHHDLIGRQVADVRTSDDMSALEFSLGVRRDFGNVHPDSRVLPVHLAGRARWRNGAGAASLAVAVNGTIRATTRTYQISERRSRDTWSVVLGPDDLRPGANLVEVFVIDATRGAPVLRRAYRSDP